MKRNVGPHLKHTRRERQQGKVAGFCPTLCHERVHTHYPERYVEVSLYQGGSWEMENTINELKIEEANHV